MTKRELRKFAERAIEKEGRTHQETFDELNSKHIYTADKLAKTISLLASPQKRRVNSQLITIFIGMMVLLAVLRIGILALIPELIVSGPIFAVALLFGLFVPIFGIVGALKGKNGVIMSTGLLLILGVIRSFTGRDMELEPSTVAILIYMAATSAFAFYLALQLKTTFKVSIEKETIDGKTTTRKVYTFEDSTLESSDLLDS